MHEQQHLSELEIKRKNCSIFASSLAFSDLGSSHVMKPNAVMYWNNDYGSGKESSGAWTVKQAWGTGIWVTGRINSFSKI